MLFFSRLAILFTCAVLIGTPAPAEAQACPGPYRVQTSDGRCVWSCAPGTTPDRATNTCVCKDGYRQTGRRANGRIVCTRPEAEERRRQPSNLSARYPFDSRTRNLCNVYRRDGGEPGYPYRCSARREQPRVFRQLRNHVINVYQTRPMTIDVIRKGRFRIRFNRPPRPAPNRNCNWRLPNVRDACVPECWRLEYLTFFESGGLHTLTRPTGANNVECLRNFTADFEVQNPGKAKAYDACSRAAIRQGRVFWGHNVRVVVHHRVAAAFFFKDAHTHGARNNWQYHLKTQHKFREARPGLQVLVQCKR